MRQAPPLTNEAFYVASHGADETNYLRIQLNGKPAVSSVSRPADSTAIRGVFSYIRTEDSRIVAAYFARQRKSPAEAPDYKGGLYLLIGERVYPCANGETKIEMRSGLFRRRFSVTCPNQESIAVEYAWPFYRELAQRVFGDPFNYVSRDFLFEALKIVETYAAKQ